MKTRMLLIACGLALFGLTVLSSSAAVAAPAAQATATPTATPTTPGFIDYTIQLGDTWATISKKFGVSASRLLDLNGLRGRPDLIFVDEIIRIPITLGDTPSLVNPFVYVVQKNETVEFIAAKFYMDRTALRDANRLKQSTKLLEGQRILIPAGPHRYVVQRGDTILSIATMFNTSVSRLLQFNPHLGDGGRIFPGNNVFVPIRYDVDTFFPAPGLVSLIASVTPSATPNAIPGLGTGIGEGGEGIGGGGEGIGGGGEGVGSPTTGFDVVNGSATAANALAVTQLGTITMPAHVVDLGKDLTIRWLSVNYVRLDPARAGFGIATLVIEFRGGNGAYRVQRLNSTGNAEALMIRGIFVKPYPDKEFYNNIEFEVKGQCGEVVGGDIVITSGSTTWIPHFIVDIACPSK